MSASGRPTAITVIGWTWIVVGSWMGLGGVMGLLTLPLSGAASFFSPPFGWVFPAGLGFQVVAGAAGVISGASLLRLTRWAYVGVQVVGGIVSAYAAAIGAFCFWFALSGMDSSPIMAVGVIGVGVWTVGAVGVPYAIMMRVLRRPAVRSMFAAPV